MKKYILTFLIVFLASCSDPVTLYKHDSGKKTALHKGDVVAILLPENPSTGFVWQFFITPERQTVISNIKETYVKPKKNLIGAIGNKKYSFIAKQKGTVTITGYYIRPWDVLDKEKNMGLTYTFEVSD